MLMKLLRRHRRSDQSDEPKKPVYEYEMSHSPEEVAQAIESLEQIEDDPRVLQQIQNMIADWRKRQSSGAIENARVDALDNRLSTPQRQAAVQFLIDVAEESL